jgi:pseudouridine-5'-phosphate glycosidase
LTGTAASASALAVSPEVAEALFARRPVVALESTIVSHGMPWPENIETALGVEDEVRQAGATPAAIAVVGGKLRVGLDRPTLEMLAKANDVLKLSSADLAYGVMSGRLGATTVAATMIVARLAGIDVFATGGIGGVHRGAEHSFDISADVTELSRTRVAVVCAGPKALLDIPKTLEYLETLGVPVITFGSDRFPAFWSRDSGLATPIRLDQPAAIAAFIRERANLGLPGGSLIANPIPEVSEIPASEIRPAIEAALVEAEKAGIGGKAVTPFLLDAILKQTGGRSLTANIALIRHNARLAARIAVALAAP